ncbi:hypothetical protein HMI54_003805 [Coelomomyces lativittatus]|nr:hypothetical protein HMI55_003970 [Coelomomyces lativittatus]KAJ1507819.1 hypothetical protein HMI54_003805 [Coelomomyces lativittatus]
MNTSILTIENKNFSSDSAKEKEPSTSALPRSSSPPDTWNPSLFLEQLSIPDPLDSGHLSPLSDVSTEYVYTAPKPLSTEVTSSLNPTSGSKAVKRRRTTVLPKKKNGRVTTTKKETNSRSHTPSFPSSFFSSEATTSVTNINVIDDLDSDTFFLSPETLEKIIKPPWDPLERRKRRISEISKVLRDKTFSFSPLILFFHCP